MSELTTTGTSVFQYQVILFRHKPNRRVLQNQNGPCSLLAMINCLLLQERANLNSGNLPIYATYTVSFRAMIQSLRTELEKLAQTAMKQEDSNLICMIAEISDIFPRLDQGLDINPKFNSVQSFDKKEIAHKFFDVFSVKLYHCWVVDPNGIFKNIYNLIAHKTYDELQDLLLAENLKNEGQDSANALLIRKFLKKTAQQHTKYGVHKLYQEMKDGQIAGLFQCNHYSTIYKNPDDHIVYELVTDEGIVSQGNKIMWKTFNPGNYFGDTTYEIYVSHDFRVFTDFDAEQGEIYKKLKRIVRHLHKYKYPVADRPDPATDSLTDHNQDDSPNNSPEKPSDLPLNDMDGIDDDSKMEEITDQRDNTPSSESPVQPNPLKAVSNMETFVQHYPLAPDPMPCRPIFDDSDDHKSDYNPKGLMELTRSKSNENDNIPTKATNPDILGLPSLGALGTMNRAVSDQAQFVGSITSHQSDHDRSSRVDIRKCRVDDVHYIFTNQEWDGLDQNSLLNELLWTKEFLKIDDTKEQVRGGFVLEIKDSQSASITSPNNKTLKTGKTPKAVNSDIIGFIFYERSEATEYFGNELPSDIQPLQDLSASKSADVEIDCKWNISDWKPISQPKGRETPDSKASHLKVPNSKRITFYQPAFVLISDLGIDKKHQHKGYGPKLLQAIIYSFPSGTQFGAEIAIENNSAIHCFGKCGFMISRLENDHFFMTLTSDFESKDVEDFKKDSIPKFVNDADVKAVIIERLKQFRSEHLKMKNAKNQLNGKHSQSASPEIIEMGDVESEDDFEDITFKPDDDETRNPNEPDQEQKDEAEEKDDESRGIVERRNYDLEKLNKLCSEIVQKGDAVLSLILRILEKTRNEGYYRQDFQQIMADIAMALPMNNDTMIDGNAVIEMVLEILYLSGFVKKQFGNEQMDRFHIDYDDDDMKDPDAPPSTRYILEFERNELEEFRLDTTSQLLGEYHTKNMNRDLEDAAAKLREKRGYTLEKQWIHVFDEGVHGKEVKDKTIKILRGICTKIIQNESDLNHKSRNLNIKTLFDKFKCQIPLSLLKKYGFVERYDVLKNEERLEFKGRDISKIREMLQKLQYHEKLSADKNIFSAMDESMQRIWMHCLSNGHGEDIRNTTISMLKKIANGILKNPHDLRARDLSWQMLEKKFQCVFPILLLQKYGFIDAVDYSRPFGKQKRLKYESSDLTPIHQMLQIVTVGEKMDMDMEQTSKEVQKIRKELNQQGVTDIPPELLRQKLLYDKQQKARENAKALEDFQTLIQGFNDARALFGGGNNGMDALNGNMNGNMGGGGGQNLRDLFGNRNDNMFGNRRPNPVDDGYNRLFNDNGNGFGNKGSNFGQPNLFNVGNAMGDSQDDDDQKYWNGTRDTDDQRSSDDDDDAADDDNDEFVEMNKLLTRAGLSKYTMEFMSNGVETRQQLMEMDVNLVSFIIPNRMDQEKFTRFVGKMQDEQRQ